MHFGLTIYGSRIRAVTAAIVGILCCASSSTAKGQDVDYFLDGEVITERGVRLSSNPDSVDVSVDRLLAQLYRTGYHFASHDSTSVLEMLLGARVYLSSGAEVTIASFSAKFDQADSPSSPVVDFQLKSGDPLDLNRLEAAIESLLNRFADEGRHMSEIRLDSLVAVGEANLAYDVFLTITPGPRVPLILFSLEGARRTESRFVASLTDIEIGTPLLGSTFKDIPSRLLNSGLFVSVGEPELEVYRDSTSTLRIPVIEAPPGTFDLVLGYLPGGGSSSSSGSGQLVGSGHLNLLSPFGSGRTIGLKLERLPGQVSSADIRIGDPQLFNLPIQIGAAFRGIQQDSTFNRRSWSVELGYRLMRGVVVASSFSEEFASPGSAGLVIVSGKQRIPRSEISFWGLRVTMNRVDNPFNPQSGIHLESTIERGDKREKSKIITAEGDTTRLGQTFRQERLHLSGRAFLRTFARQTVVFGTDVSVLLSDSTDESDLFRVGGANSLRGYDEDQFLASTAIRLLFEYRLLLDTASYTFVFVDIGYIETPVIGELPISRAWHPGFGFGMQFSTAAGLISASYAMNSDDGIGNGRVHLGISFGL